MSVMTWTMQSGKNPRNKCTVSTDGKHWFVSPLPIHPLIPMFSGIPQMVKRNGRGKPSIQWDGPNGAKAQCSDVLAPFIIAVVDRLIQRCAAEYAADPTAEHGDIEYASIWDATPYVPAMPKPTDIPQPA